ncbi:phage holin family protein [Anaerorhabdus sp.]|uniref:phage holin family protein n=1 Tax=Anaerorhabdus sp. TaxID=1872524 RepID=UPI002FC77C4B
MNLQEFMNVGITLICLGMGFVLKLWVKDLDNKYIPTLVFVLGIALSVMASGFTIEAVNTGWISGIASTGLYELVHQLMKNKTPQE